MSTNLTSIEIATLKPSDLFRLVEEVNATKQPRILKRDREPVAMLMPIGTTVKPKKKQAPTKADYETFLSAFGSWKDVDTEKLKRDIYDTRKHSNRPPIEL